MLHFSAPGTLRAVLDGRKTVTRRRCKPGDHLVTFGGGLAVLRNGRILWRVGSLVPIRELSAG